ncbi:hypothetical protein [Isachenkonia alkalipeptolytica]|uniref:hypothetical protein n=1 Tax=Isachenkonia alkalipeptolytica TaxID=2565777 RepID=UPI0027D31B06|nr:hypothetical protein [Isachenkonia alkalipeptolytica]
MKAIKTEDVVGMVLGHDITKIVPGEFKGVAFKKGHIIEDKDIQELLNIGKEHIYIMEFSPEEIHEDEAAIKLGRLALGGGVRLTLPSQGKVNLPAKEEGLLKVNKELLFEINDLGEICFVTIYGNHRIKKGGLIAGCRIIPLIIKKEKI